MIPIAAAADIPSGEVKLVRAGRCLIALCRIADSFSAFEARCPHADVLLAPAKLNHGGSISCPLHGSVFSAETGQVLAGPAEKGLGRYSVTEKDGMVFLREPVVGAELADSETVPPPKRRGEWK